MAQAQAKWKNQMNKTSVRGRLRTIHMLYVSVFCLLVGSQASKYHMCLVL